MTELSYLETSAERLAWLIVVATIPVGITGLALEHTFRTLFAKPLFGAVFLTINGLILLAGERLRGNAEHRHVAGNGLLSAHPESHGASGARPDDRTTTGPPPQARGLIAGVACIARFA